MKAIIELQSQEETEKMQMRFSIFFFYHKVTGFALGPLLIHCVPGWKQIYTLDTVRFTYSKHIKKNCICKNNVIPHAEKNHVIKITYAFTPELLGLL